MLTVLETLAIVCQGIRRPVAGLGVEDADRHNLTQRWHRCSPGVYVALDPKFIIAVNPASLRPYTPT